MELQVHSLIGRISRMDLQLNDPRISEVHALVTLKDGSLWLKGLGAPLFVNGKSEPQVRLAQDVEVELARSGIFLRVEKLYLPQQFPTLTLPDQPPQTLAASSYHLTAGMQLAAGLHPDALLSLWSIGEDWFFRLATGEEGPCEDKKDWSIAGRSVHFGLCVGAKLVKTIQDDSLPRTYVIGSSTVSIKRENRRDVVFDGQQAQLLKLAILHGRNPETAFKWFDVVEEIWWPAFERDQRRLGIDPEKMRDDFNKRKQKNYFVCIGGIRKRLHQEGIDKQILGTGNAFLTFRFREG
ncbi:MAG TPA: FHA domain-containing protein, partial [Myxococcota bacterium]|nr:FHA domain-containing protein [Myxococcota bacterium]